MKSAIAFAAFVAALTGCASQPAPLNLPHDHDHALTSSKPETPPAAPDRADERLAIGTAEARVNGLSCPLCAESLNAVMRRVEGVESVRLNLDKGTVSVRIGKARPTRGQVAKAIDDAGFTFIEFLDNQGE